MPRNDRPPSVTAYLTVRGGKEAIDFYRKAFGAKIGMVMMAEDKKRVMHARLEMNGGTVMLSDTFDEFGDQDGTKPPPEAGGASVTIHLDCDNVDRAWKKAVTAGATVVMPLADMFWGDRYGKLRDPFGHVWSLATPIEAPTARPKAAKKAAKKRAAKKKKKR